MVKESPTFDKVWVEIETYVNKYGTVGTISTIGVHYAYFDIPVLLATLKYYKIEPPVFFVIDSCIAARNAWPQLPNHKLPTLANYLKTDLQHHDALSDAKICAQILIAINKTAPKNILKLTKYHVCDKKMYNTLFFGR